MTVRHIGLVSYVPQQLTPFAELTRVSAALQKQATRDFGPLWGVRGTVDVFPSLDDVPVGYWPVVVVDRLPMRAGGVHVDENGQPIAFVVYNPLGWSLAASHEVLEMLADPFGKTMIAGPSLKPDQGRVEYLLEVCDPCEGPEYAYTVNGVIVSDFVTPHFHDPVASGGARYSFSGAVTAPRRLLPGGYISWKDPISNQWWQAMNRTGKLEFRRLRIRDAALNLRVAVNRATPPPEWFMKGIDPKQKSVAKAVAAGETARASASSQAEEWRKQFAVLRRKK